WALGRTGQATEPQIAEITKLLKDKSPKVRINAVDALLSLDAPARKHNADIAALLKDPDVRVRTITATALGRMGSSAADQAPALGDLVTAANDDKQVNMDTMLAALGALGEIGHAAGGQADKVAPVLGSKKTVLRIAARKSLWMISPLGRNVVMQILGATYRYPAEADQLRLLAHYGSAGGEESETLIRWIGAGADKVPGELNRKEGAQILGIYLDNWGFTEGRKEMRDDFVVRISETVKAGTWTKEDLPLLKKAGETLKTGKYENQANAVNETIGKVQG
ncbi:MAG TPA: HEAT repeat domain-containing protein, partial [Thermodesulfobacteriota bacterium]|nr:HEAT repeat domain-containing protein [Thermodesulfobacteriota bacterium]